jgi:hypothetical protein
MTGTTLRYGLGPGGVYLVVHGHKPPQHEEWKRYVEDMEEHARAGSLRTVFILSAGALPDALQRKCVTQMWQRVGTNPPIIGVGHGRLSRGVVTAINWLLSRPMRLFSTDEFQSAVEQLALTDADRRAFLVQLGRAKLHFGSDFGAQDAD